MKLITNIIICLIIVFASNLLNMGIVFAQDENPPIIVEGDSSIPYEPDTIYTQN